jgi:hypothetical protein
MMPPMRWKSSKRSRRAPAVAATTTHVTMTTVEWPSEKKVPTATGRWPAAMRRRVVRSMAEMWSASRACRRPRVLGCGLLLVFCTGLGIYLMQ